MAKNEKAVASVLAFEKKLVPSDGYFYGTTWKNRTEQSLLSHNFSQEEAHLSFLLFYGYFIG